jgi:hypothetical protein
MKTGRPSISMMSTRWCQPPDAMPHGPPGDPASEIIKAPSQSSTALGLFSHDVGYIKEPCTG